MSAVNIDGLQIKRGRCPVRKEALDMSYQQQISLSTQGHGDMHDITEQVAAVVSSSGVRTGIVNVFNTGSTAAVGTIVGQTQDCGRDQS